ncbi:MAG TPA: AMP-binding protein [Baekduia sp.]|uniref:acyl-CoA synthetase n=1 Tax=Baekduia sp. TaxID=2600305 RepID=UPI002D77365E|nr:AMP-binding protein [Baekduia sp.]HET6507822.1 AMP-binding protein [Baekduia sp.]
MTPARTRPTRTSAPRMTEYASERRTFGLHPPERFNAVIGIVDAWAVDEPDAPAVLSVAGDGEPVALQTAADLARAAGEAARALLELGVAQGDRVFVMLPHGPTWYAALLGCMRIGAVPMPGPNLLTPKDIAYRVGRGGARVAITDANGAAKVDASGAVLDVKLCGGGGGARAGWLDFGERCARAGGDPLPADPTHRDDPLLLYFTSGTVSEPKMVEHVQSYALGHVGTARFWHDLRPGDRHWTVADTGWAKAAWGGLFGQFHERACVVQVALGRPDADTVLGIVARHGVTSFCAPPTLYRMLVQGDFSRHDLSSLRHCTSAGEPLNPEVIRAWEDGTGLTIHDGYGQTETTCLVANYRSVPVRQGSMGRPMPGWDVVVVDDGGSPVGAGVVGNVAVRCEPNHPIGLFRGYEGDAEATARVFRAGLYFTGDKAAVDPDGYLWFEGRDDDVITSSAYRIGPFEVESALIEHPAVTETAVVGRDDPDRTQVVVGVCVLANGYGPSDALARELQDHVKQTTAPYKYPREIHFVDELPKTVSGKIRRSELRAWLHAGRLSAREGR